jgi:ATP-binding cassette subfamily C protein CydC
VEGIQGLADLLAFGREADYAGKLQEEGKLYANTQKHLASLNGFSNALTVLLVNLGMLAVLVLTIPLVRDGQIPGVMLAVLTLVASAGFEAVMPLSLAAQTLSSSRQAAARLFEIVDVKPEVEDAREQRPERREQGAGNKGLFSSLSFYALSFTYPNQSQPALQDISFQLEPGKRIAIVGPSGAGKTTLANLLLRFWDFSQGKILLDSRDLHDFAQEDVRRMFGFISQRTYFFNDTIRRNLLLARPEASEAELVEAAQRAEIHEFITGLPMGYETYIGERGFRLSAGERQRLGLARAFLKDAPILLLDEPTANLDTLNERRILETLFRTSSGRALLLITHRLVGLENMDEILVLSEGRIVESGTQAELLRRGGLFASMWEVQNRVLEI